MGADFALICHTDSCTEVMKETEDRLNQTENRLMQLLQKWNHENKRGHKELETLLQKRTSDLINKWSNTYGVNLLNIVTLLVVIVLAFNSQMVRQTTPNKTNTNTLFSNKSCCDSNQDPGTQYNGKNEKSLVGECRRKRATQKEHGEEHSETKHEPETNTNSQTNDDEKGSLGELNGRDSTDPAEDTDISEYVDNGHLSDKQSLEPLEIMNPPTQNSSYEQQQEWESDATYVKSTVPFRLDDLDILPTMNTESNDDAKHDRDLPCLQSNSLVMENATVFIGKDYYGSNECPRKMRINNTETELHARCVCHDCKKEVHVKIVDKINSSCYVGTVHRHSRLLSCENKDTILVDKSNNTEATEGTKFVPTGAPATGEGNCTSITNKHDFHRDGVIAADEMQHTSEETLALACSEVEPHLDSMGNVILNIERADLVGESGDNIEDQEEHQVDGIIRTERQSMVNQQSLPLQGLLNGSNSDAESNNSHVEASSGDAEITNGVVGTGISHQMHELMQCISLRVDDVPGPITSNGNGYSFFVTY